MFKGHWKGHNYLFGQGPRVSLNPIFPCFLSISFCLSVFLFPYLLISELRGHRGLSDSEVQPGWAACWEPAELQSQACRRHWVKTALFLLFTVCMPWSDTLRECATTYRQDCHDAPLTETVPALLMHFIYVVWFDTFSRYPHPIINPPLLISLSLLSPTPPS